MTHHVVVKNDIRSRYNRTIPINLTKPNSSSGCTKGTIEAHGGLNWSAQGRTWVKPLNTFRAWNDPTQQSDMGRFEQEAPFIAYFLVFTWRPAFHPRGLRRTPKNSRCVTALCVLIHVLSPSLSRWNQHAYTLAYPRCSVDRGRFVAFLTPATRACRWK